MSRSRVLGVLALLVIAAAGWFWLRRGGEEAPRYRTARAERGAVEAAVAATGTIRPVEQVDVGSQVSGTVNRLNADYNSRVRAGQVLCQIDPSAFRARVAQGEAAVARAEAAVREARRQLDRARELLPQNYVSQADVDAVESTLQQREADLKQARAQLDAAQVDFANTTIRSPIDGVVIARSVNLGQTVAASLQSPKLFVIANDLSQMQVETRIDEADIGQIRPGLSVNFTVDAFPEQRFRGLVSQVRLEPIVEQNVVTYTTVIRTENSELKLRPGMTANVSVQVASLDSVLLVPNSALRFRPVSETARGGRASAGLGIAAAGRGVGRSDRGDATGAPAAARPGRIVAGASSGGASSGGGSRPRAMPETGPMVMGTVSEPAMKPGAVYVLSNGKPVKVGIMTGITDGAFTEVGGDALQVGALVIVGVESSKRSSTVQLPPGMGGRTR